MKTLDNLQRLGFVEQRATGSSMMHFIRGGDQLIIIKKSRRLSKGEIGLFVQDQKMVLHRVKKVKKDGYIFSGDNRYHSDGFISEEEVKGRLVAIYKRNKKVECDSKSFRVKSAFYNCFLFKPFLIFFMRILSRIK